MTAKPDRLNQLDSAVTLGSDTLVLKHALEGIKEGTTLAIDLEEYQVVAYTGTAAGSSVTVIPAMNGSTSSAHAEDALVYISPQFSPWRMAKYVNQSLDDITAMQIFRIKSLEFDYISSRLGYEIVAPDILDIWRVRYDQPGPARHWPILSPRDWEFDQAANITDFPSGKAIFLNRGGHPGHKVYVSYRAKFDPLFDFATFDPVTDYADDVLTTTGLHREAHPILAMDAALSLLVGREVKRTFLDHQPEPRRQEEVPVGGASQAMRPLLLELSEKVNREVRRLKRLYPEMVY
jgi:hypothetical protein